MSGLVKQKILEKLENFKQYLEYLHKLRDEARDEKVFLSDFHLFGNTERYLHLCIQIIIDISHLIIIDLGLKRPQDNYEAVFMLYENKIITSVLSKKLDKMIGLRNILVHEYGKIDEREIFSILKKNIKDLEEFKIQIIKFIKR